MIFQWEYAERPSAYERLVPYLAIWDTAGFDDPVPRYAFLKWKPILTHNWRRPTEDEVRLYYTSPYSQFNL